MVRVSDLQMKKSGECVAQHYEYTLINLYLNIIKW